MMTEPTPLIRVVGLEKLFSVREGLLQRVTSHVHAVDGVSFDIQSGESFGLVGESSCGKTTLGLTLLRLLEPTRGEIWFDGQDIVGLPESDMNRLRPNMQIVFQNPFRSLDPHMRVKDLVAEPLRIHKRASGAGLLRQVAELLTSVGLGTESLYRFPRDLSGGQRQRVAVARAIALHPRFVVLDEPTSALDVSVQAQVLNLLADLQRDIGLTYLFVSHDLGVIRHVCNRVAVMYLGSIVEMAETDRIFDAPAHPYTQALLAAIPEPDPAARPVGYLRGEARQSSTRLGGCPFAPRCAVRLSDVCLQVKPELRPLTLDHKVACHLYSETKPGPSA